VRAHVLGIVINRSERDRGEAYYYYRRRDETRAVDEPAPRRRRVRV
jgi:hypothetical protein